MKKTSINKIFNTVAQFYHVSPKKLQKKSRKAKFIKPRHITMYLLREELNRSFPYIGRLFGRKDHTTVIHAYRKITELLRKSPELRLELEQIKNVLYNQPSNEQSFSKSENSRNKIDHQEKNSKNIEKPNINEKRERFKRLATYRTNEILRKLKILGHCANRSAYEYTEEEINKIFSEIKRKVEEVKAKFYFPKKEKEFKL